MKTLEAKNLPKFDAEAFEKKVQLWLDNPNNSVEAMTARVRASRAPQLTVQELTSRTRARSLREASVGEVATRVAAPLPEGTPEPTSGRTGPIHRVILDPLTVKGQQKYNVYFQDDLILEEVTSPEPAACKVLQDRGLTGICEFSRKGRDQIDFRMAIESGAKKALKRDIEIKWGPWQKKIEANGSVVNVRTTINDPNIGYYMDGSPIEDSSNETPIVEKKKIKSISDY